MKTRIRKRRRYLSRDFRFRAILQERVVHQEFDGHWEQSAAIGDVQQREYAAKIGDRGRYQHFHGPVAGISYRESIIERSAIDRFER